MENKIICPYCKKEMIPEYIDKSLIYQCNMCETEISHKTCVNLLGKVLLYIDCEKNNCSVLNFCADYQWHKRNTNDDKEYFKLKKDMINHPSHYTKGIETIDYIKSWDMDYIEGNIIKYITRYKYKNKKEDLEKCRWYLNKLIENYNK